MIEGVDGQYNYAIIDVSAAKSGSQQIHLSVMGLNNQLLFSRELNLSKD